MKTAENNQFSAFSAAGKSIGLNLCESGTPLCPSYESDKAD
jgi:hypothetical protein